MKRIRFWKWVVTYDAPRRRVRRLFGSEREARRLYKALARAQAPFQAIYSFERPVRRGRRRRLGNLWFICDRPGWWFSECGRSAVFCMLRGTAQEQWELYRQGQDSRGRWVDTQEHLESGLAMADLDRAKVLREAT